MTGAVTGSNAGAVSALAALARLPAPRDAEGPAAARAPRRPEVLSARAGGLVVRVAGTVVKAHAPGTDPEALARRLAAIRHPSLAGLFLPPLRPDPAPLPDGRAATVWPHAEPLDRTTADPESVPWEAAGRLLAALHAVDPGPLRLPAMGGPARAARAVARLARADVPAAARAAVERAWAGLPAWCRAEAPPPRPWAVCHGDFHLGQLVGPPWLLIDVDDLGVGEPWWDLARPAAWYAAGLLPADCWRRLLAGYGAAGTTGGWPPGLEAPARTLTAQLAATALLAGDEANQEAAALVEACSRISHHPLC